MRKINRLVLCAAIALPLGFALGNSAIAGKQSIQLDIKTSCSARGAVFKVANLGGKWPSAARFNIYRGGELQPLSKRSLRMTEGQKMSFVVKPKYFQGKPVSMWVEPVWYKRKKLTDAKIDCGS